MKENVLNIHIDYVKSIELKILAESLDSMSSLYKEFMENYNYHFDYDAKLYIQEIKNGSIDIFLRAGEAISLLDTAKPLIEFGNHVFTLIEFLLGKKDTPPKNVTKKTYKNITKLYEITAKDSFNGNTSINIGELHLTIDNTSANALQNKAKSMIENLQENQEYYEKVEMYWASANFIENKQDGKVVIQSISSKPTNVIFLDEIEKKKCTTKNDKYNDKNWQDLLYVVDVKVIYVDNRLTGYRIIKVYDDVLPIIE